MLHGAGPPAHGPFTGFCRLCSMTGVAWVLDTVPVVPLSCSPRWWPAAPLLMSNKGCTSERRLDCTMASNPWAKVGLRTSHGHKNAHDHKAPQGDSQGIS